MPTKTLHVLPDKRSKRWIVRKSAASAPRFFATKKEATDEAERLIKDKAGQVVVLGKDGKIVSAKTHGLPRIHRAPARSKIRSRDIERAVSQVIKERLAAAE